MIQVSLTLQEIDLLLTICDKVQISGLGTTQTMLSAAQKLHTAKIESQGATALPTAKQG